MTIMHHDTQITHPAWCTHHTGDPVTDPEHLGDPEHLVLADGWLVDLRLSRKDEIPAGGVQHTGPVGVLLGLVSQQLVTVPGQAVAAAPFLTAADARALGEQLLAAAGAADRAGADVTL